MISLTKVKVAYVEFLCDPVGRHKLEKVLEKEIHSTVLFDLYSLNILTSTLLL